MFPNDILFITDCKLISLVINVEKAVTQSQIKKQKTQACICCPVNFSIASHIK